jgi:hypothetical protein
MREVLSWFFRRASHLGQVGSLRIEIPQFASLLTLHFLKLPEETNRKDAKDAEIFSFIFSSALSAPPR